MESSRQSNRFELLAKEYRAPITRQPERLPRSWTGHQHPSDHPTAPHAEFRLTLYVEYWGQRVW